MSALSRREERATATRGSTRRMRCFPLLARLALALAAGALATLATAWIPALQGTTSSPHVPPARGPQHYLAIRRPPDPSQPAEQRTAWAWLVNRHASLAHTAYVFRAGGVAVGPDEQPLESSLFVRDPMPLPPWARIPDRGMRIDRHAYAWPFAALGATYVSPGATHDFWEVRPSRVTPAGAWCPPLRLPVTPIWSGLVADVLIWAALAHVAILTLGASRRRRRLRRGLCPACAYPLDSSVPCCPECGKVAKPLSVRTLTARDTTPDTEDAMPDRNGDAAHWICLADGRSARLLKADVTGGGRWHIDDVDSLQNQWEDDKQHTGPHYLARMTERGGAPSYAARPHQEQEQRRRFAKEASEWLGRQLKQHNVESVHVFAAAAMLGDLRQHANKHVWQQVTAHEAELMPIPTSDLVKHPAIESVLNSPKRPA